jgi:PKD domain-containing protein/parallel beta helix pectate lyase-like protein/polymorphic membrane protein
VKNKNKYKEDIMKNNKIYPDNHSNVFSISVSSQYLFMACICLSLLLNSASLWAVVYRVNDDAASGGDGLTWSTAYNSIQDAVYRASNDGGGEIWVAAGTYTAISSSVVRMMDKVHIYGGFAGGESTRDQRNWKANKTIIDGENFRRCVYGADGASLDGFIIKNGNAYDGGGMYNRSSSPTITNCTFTGNIARGGIGSTGGGMYNKSSSPTITNCTFTGNIAMGGAGSTGGAMHNDSSAPIIRNCIFINNTSYRGGGIYNTSSTPKITNCIFAENIVFYDGDKGGFGGGMYNRSSSPIVTNCTFIKNMAIEGGGMYNYKSSPTITNSIVRDNSSGIVEGDDSNSRITYSLVQEGYGGEGNIDTDPLLDQFSFRPLPGSPCIDAGNPDASGLPETDFLSNARVLNGCVDMGVYEYIPGALASNLTIVLGPQEILPLTPRFRIGCGPWLESGQTIQIYSGDYSIEFSPLIHWQEPDITSIKVSPIDSSETFNYSSSPGNYLWYVDINASGKNNGKSWPDAYTDIQSAINAASKDDFGEIWITAGTYTGTGSNVAELKKGIHLYGGFTDNETTRGQRNWNENKTIINGEDSRRCVIGADDAGLDGFILTNGYADEEGGGMYNYFSSPMISNCIFTGNKAMSHGSGMYNAFSSPIVRNCMFTGNKAMKSGGAICNSYSMPTVQNCTLTGNTANQGGGMYYYNHSSSHPIVMNCILWKNSSEIEGTPPLITYSLVQGGYSGEGNIDTAPMLDPFCFRPLPGSPCIDSGDPNAVDFAETDFLGNARKLNGRVDMGGCEYVPGEMNVDLTITLGPAEILSLNPHWRLGDSPWLGLWMESGSTIQIYPGDYSIEFSPFVHWQQPVAASITVDPIDSSETFNYTSSPGNYLWYVDINASGENNGKSWLDAFTDIQSAIDAASLDGIGEIRVAAGTYTGSGDNVVEMKENVYLYGGFSGVETTRDQRNWNRNLSIIYGERSRRCIRGADNATVDGFVIKNGNADNGGGMYNSFSSPKVTNCIFTENLASSKGGAIYNHLSSPTVINSIFKNNSRDMYNESSSPKIMNCTFTKSGGMYNKSSSPNIMNSIFWENSDEIAGTDDSNAYITYSIVQGGYSGEGNIDTDPLIDQFNARPLPGSPCIDAGNPNASDLPEADFLNNTRVQNGRVDMGPFEYFNNAQPVNLTITLGPQEILLHNPQWRIGLGPWFESGATVQIYPGDYSIGFSDFLNWQLPSVTWITVSTNGDSKIFNYSPSSDSYLWYVDVNASGENNGKSWLNAFTDIQSAIHAAWVDGLGKIWVADGTYKGATLEMVENVHLYGGFSGNESSFNQRNWNDNKTIIDGEKSRCCVTGADNATIDGFVIKNGNNYEGGGMSNSSVSPIVRNCTFTNNEAKYGGGMINLASVPTITNCTFTDNSASIRGGAMYNSIFSPIITNCTFTGNSSDSSGGAMYNYNCSPNVTNSSFISNEASNGGGMFNLAIETSFSMPKLAICSSPQLTNCVFIFNKADMDGGGMCNSSTLYARSEPILINCSFSGNTANSGGYGGINVDFHSRPTIRNCIFWNNNPKMEGLLSNITYSCFNGRASGEGNIYSNPLFVDADNGDLRLLPYSPCIDTGTAEGAPDADILGFPRPSGAYIDMGAYEYNNTVTPTPTPVLVADFFAHPTVTLVGNDVRFFDDSTGSPNEWNWNFGDSEVSNLGFPVHSYDSPGTYTVSLTVSGSFGSDTETKEDYIIIVPIMSNELMIDYLLGKEEIPFGDVNNDGITDIADLLALIKMK